MELKNLRRKDYERVITYAIEGMHLDWYIDNPFVLKAYGKYFLYMELNRATQNIAAYDGDSLKGVLLAKINEEKPSEYSLLRAVYVKVFDFLQHIVSGDAVREYDDANQKMLSVYRARDKTDGELIFLAADPDSKGKGIGALLLAELERREQGRRIYLFTDSACTYQFYEHRGFERVSEEHIELELDEKTVPLDCYLYSKRL